MSLAAFALIASPLLSFLGVLLGNRTSRRGTVELDRWRKREETMRLLRWGTEVALDDDLARSRAGLTVLSGLLDASLLDDDDRHLVAAVTRAVAAASRDMLNPEEHPP
jgi:hypothetical protein